MSARASGPALGRGLSALIPSRDDASDGAREIPLSEIRINPNQPRRDVEHANLEALALSITDHGVLQPILVTETLDGYRIVAGERRVQAARLAGLERIPAVIRQLADREQLELALVENVQREDLNPIEEANAFRQLHEEFGLTQDEIARQVGRARTTVTNTLRLLELDEGVQAAIADGRISEGHARPLVGLPAAHQLHLVGAIVEDGLSVRQAEELARRLREPKPTTDKAERRTDPDLERVEEDLRIALGTKVLVARGRKGGRIVIEYYNDEDLGRLYDHLTGGPA
ncbi:MAG TPA: ParB/RepB/Spo0J family partition protein [Candidatus Limnocylindrales bacterium]|nr:ParB/RepB/Spo0J family partition protein [Candidatus Limnocylindrales bacterium]